MYSVAMFLVSSKVIYLVSAICSLYVAVVAFFARSAGPPSFLTMLFWVGGALLLFVASCGVRFSMPAMGLVVIVLLDPTSDGSLGLSPKYEREAKGIESSQNLSLTQIVLVIVS